MARPISWSVEKTDISAIVVKFTIKNIKDEMRFLCSSDRHHDNPDCNRDLEYKHLDKAIDYGAGIIDIGDMFCAMQGKYDKRSNKSKLRPEHQTGDYFDALVRTTANDYQKYAKNWISMGRGNHETSVQEKHEIDLIERLAATLNDRTGSNIHTLGYTGWVKFQIIYDGSKRTNRTLWFTHGYGGGGPVTQDTIQANRQQVYIENADIMMSGHVHRSWSMEFVKQRLNHSGVIETRSGWYLKLPTYKDGYGKGVRGFEVEKGHGPRPLGAYWLKFYADRVKGNVVIGCSVEKAV